MQCPFCGDADSSVTETRDSPDGLRRRRVCASCKRRFTTYEKVGSPGLKVEKRDGSLESFELDKLLTALRRVCAHRPVRDEVLRELGRQVSASLVDSGQKTVAWSVIVDELLRRLVNVDAVAARRLAANYQDEAGILRLGDAPHDEGVPPQLGLFGDDELPE